MLNTASFRRSRSHRCAKIVAIMLCAVGAVDLRCNGAPITSKHKIGTTHAFIALKSDSGKLLAIGDLAQQSAGEEIHSRLRFTFRDGSVDEETTNLRQTDVIRLVSDHHIQKGPSFPQPLDLSVNVPKSEVTWREWKKNEQKLSKETLKLPDDLINGLTAAVLENMEGQNQREFPFLTVSGSKPRIVKLVITADGTEKFSVGGIIEYPAKRYNIHIDIGGIAGVIAPLVGKQPVDSKAWVVDGDVPTFARLQGPFFLSGPIWSAELTSPIWNKVNQTSQEKKAGRQFSEQE
jgi:hypothetical protein